MIVMNEKTFSAPPRRTRWARALPAIAAALVGANLWLVTRVVRDHRRDAREHDFWVLCQPGFAPDERAPAFRRLVAAGNTQWRGAEVRGLNLTGLVARGADLQHAGFLRTNLAGAQLNAAKLCGSKLELADLTGARLTGADLREARLLQAIAKGAVFTRANLAGSSREQLQAENADFSGTELADANCLMANFALAKLTGANLSGARLESAVLRGAELTGARLEGANLADADFTDTNWWRARGLTTRQLAQLKEKFPPTAAADPALKDDYHRWSGRP